jgi:branched-subunit amino acid aminotransferase/4-amino-4-deoxychorismate lyase
MGFEPQFTDVSGKIQQLLTANNILDAAVRISILEDGTLLLHATTLPEARKNIRAITYESIEGLPRIKHINRIIYFPAQENAKALEAETALFVTHGKFIESIFSNIVSMTSEGKLVTPSLAKEGLKGIMREVLIDKKVLHEMEMPFVTTQPIVLINSLRMHSVITLNAIELPDPTSLSAIVAQYIAEEEKAYADTHHR